jgi:hypothetical protein
LQAPPFGVHGGRQYPPTHCWEQHWVVEEHCVPPGWQLAGPQMPLLQVCEQHCVFELHWLPFGVQAVPQMPL